MIGDWEERSMFIQGRDHNMADAISDERRRQEMMLERAQHSLYIIAGANLSGYKSEAEMIEHLQKIARLTYEDITKKE